MSDLWLIRWLLADPLALTDEAFALAEVSRPRGARGAHFPEAEELPASSEANLEAGRPLQSTWANSWMRDAG
jgi:hypothetical protein